ncbi:MULTISPECIES: hypothetical protein [Asticcacaulis]|uniref:hypothetical protein n=1 Tax=Asticcacaulis TaxID=76890 RepID=UPI001AE80EF0|nr:MULTISPECIES: hypothetical protein [Asticcacaulis]MBP2158077.1 very-short-patch-repair endonuclease [Asticcacaulis solisilvae]MDR6799122.1 very-short-patch-repair endonuclease [Asticcacaulis sp. BE141]
MVKFTLAIVSAHDEKRDQWFMEQGIYIQRINAVDLLADVDETAGGVINLVIERWQALQEAPPTVASDGPPSP